MSIGVGLALNFVRQLFTWARRIEEPDAEDAREQRAKDHRKAVLVILVPIVCALLGLVGTAIASHFTHP